MQKLNVLIADDDPLSRMVLERSVVQWGHNYVSASDGQAAQELLKNQQFDVCIFDWEMPNMTGLELCEWVKSGHGKTVSRVILNTSKDDPSHIRAAYEAGADDYITKPTDVRYLRRQLTRLADQISQFQAF